MKAFKWPCKRREAHGAHPIEEVCDNFFDCNAPYHKDTATGVVHVSDCPGVQAHPNTMIGGSNR